jgi:hypothetical protein
MSKIKSVLVEDLEHCIVCGRSPVEMHHVLFGNFGAGRKSSDKDGYVIPLCCEHHRGNTGIHHDQGMRLQWARIAQKHFEENHSRQDFIKRYGRSFL